MPDHPTDDPPPEDPARPPGPPGELEPVREGRRRFGAVLTLAAGAGLFLAHTEVLIRGPGYAGPLLVLDHLFDLALAVGAVALFVATGRRILRLLALEPSHPTDAFLWGAALGAGGWGSALLLLGAVGFLEPLPLAFLVVLGAVWLRKDLGDTPGLLGSVGHDLGSGGASGGDDGILRVLAAGVGVAVALFLVLHGGAPPGDWDSLMYHLEIPAQWLEEGGIHVPPGNLHVAYVGLFHLLYVPFLALESSAAPALLNGAFALLLGLAVHRTASVLFDRETALFSTIVLWASTGLLLVAVTARIDTSLAFLLLLGQGAVASALVEPSRARGHLLRAALVLGIAAGAKYHGLAFAAAVAPLGLWALWRAEGDRGVRLAILWIGAGLFLVGVVPVLLKNVLLVGQPFYPFFSPRLLQPWLADLLGTPVVPPDLAAVAYGALRQAREAFDPVALFLAPERLTVEPEGVHYHLNPLFLLLPLWAFHLRSRAAAALLVPALAYLVGLAVITPMTNLRYLFPALPALTVITAYFAVSAVRGVLRRVSGRRPGRTGWAVLVVAGLATLLPTARSAWAWTTRAPVIGQAVGSTSPQEYLQAGFSYYAGLAGTVNRNVPADGRVLLLWEARGFYLAPDYLPDNLATYWPLVRARVEETGECLGDTGISHVMAATAAARYYRQRGSDPELVDLDGFAVFADRCLEPVEVGPAFGLYRLRSAGGP